jgi:aryl-alcohol dehydrogenase-like predicted oxidoreductase
MDEADLDYHRETDLACIPYSSQGKGYFTKLAEDRLKDSDVRSYDSPQNRARYERVRELADKHGVSVTVITLAYLSSQPFPVSAIIGPRTLAQLDDSLTDSYLTLSLDELAYLENTD